MYFSVAMRSVSGYVTEGKQEKRPERDSKGAG